MSDQKDMPGRGAASAWGQAVTAVVLVGAIGIGLWTMQRTSSSDADSASAPPACTGGQPATPSKKAGNASGTKTGTTSRPASGRQLCEALNRPDLAELLGTPGETAKAASGNSGSLTSAGGSEIATPSARVELGTYTVNLAASYDRMPVTEYAALLGTGEDSQQQRVLGRPAVMYADHTISIRFNGSDTSSGPGAPARSLAVALDTKDSGGSFEITLWRTDGGAADDTALLRVAEKVLPAIPGWTAQG